MCGEERMLAVPQLIGDHPETQVILLDDAFQHRSIKPGLNLMVTDYSRLFTRDHVVPVGRLREGRKGYHRADGIIVSKCPAELTVSEKIISAGKSTRCLISNCSSPRCSTVFRPIC